MHTWMFQRPTGSRSAFNPPRRRRQFREILCLGLFVPLLVVSTSTGRVAPADRQIPNINITNDSNYRWGEPEIAVNPRNPNNIVYAALGEGFTNACQQQALTDPNSPCTLQNTDFGPQPNGLMDNMPGFSVIDTWVMFDGGRRWT